MRRREFIALFGDAAAWNYLVEHKAGQIISDSFEIYFHNFRTLFLVYAPPALGDWLLNFDYQTDNPALIILPVFLSFFTTSIAYGAISIAVSDICIGNAPSIKRSYKKVLGKMVLQFAGTYVLQFLIVIVGILALVIPGIVMGVWFMFVAPIIMLEGKLGLAALRRSKQLGNGFHWRNFGLLILVTIICMLLAALVGSPAMAYAIYNPDFFQTWIFQTVMGVLGVFFSPIFFIALILIYYDLRVRKEGYDTKALAEDLAR